ncbi:nucleotidyltransferase family protein [Mucilaginibacter aquariorum]|uniref:Nucleotidyltransferase domain-containing protein n=1 Tax=Mucilaginibacter aquariorum TaxID=2967225 RepID=A0ABT1SXI4_9SPHI|nr:nucleotidyltransferase domain-containing protein [Mucilaginibacter aquariorum]MCQ6957061.1 nucleotidyltransferase domain-containing protein [Mucilaginibacter aquariorum]
MIRNLAVFQSPEFIELCKGHEVKELYVFGSVARGTDTDTSDIDLLVEIDVPDPINKGKLLLSSYNQLQMHFNKKVDLITDTSMKSPLFKNEIATSKKIVCTRD